MYCRSLARQTASSSRAFSCDERQSWSPLRSAGSAPPRWRGRERALSARRPLSFRVGQTGDRKRRETPREALRAFMLPISPQRLGTRPCCLIRQRIRDRYARQKNLISTEGPRAAPPGKGFTTVITAHTTQPGKAVAKTPNIRRSAHTTRGEAQDVLLLMS